MEPITVATVVRSFASLIMTENMSDRTKRILVVCMSVILFVGYAATHSSPFFEALLNGLTAGFSALGIHTLTELSTDENKG